MIQHEKIMLSSLRLLTDNFPPSGYMTLSFYIRSLLYHETNSYHKYISGASDPIQWVLCKVMCNIWWCKPKKKTNSNTKPNIFTYLNWNHFHNKIPWKNLGKTAHQKTEIQTFRKLQAGSGQVSIFKFDHKIVIPLTK